MKRLALPRTPREANSGTNPGLVNSKAHAPNYHTLAPPPESGTLHPWAETVWAAAGSRPAAQPDRPRRGTPLTLRVAGSDEDGRAGATNERRPSRAARRRCGQSARRWRGKGRVLGRLALGRASGALAPHKPRGRPAWARALRRREVRRGPSAQAKTSPEGTARSTARIPLSPRGAVFASQRSEVSGARHPSLSGVPRGHPARPCTPRVSPLGDTGTEKGISAADCSRHYPPLLPLRLTFKPRQNGAAARLRPGRMHKDFPPVLVRTTVMI
ncbi:uncharacterized protein LOC116596143 [Mustela erminea]|uniref:uncharacterized protein LOC116596143 n=1 Tax=Mustela erminea TaxID=36723 RepID=UPI0013867E5D|nr:uncharacterized protein LOC116596143 [Mustela erminea]